MSRAGTERGAGVAGRRWRAVTGVLAGALVALTLGLVVAAVLADRYDVPGPGADALAWHGIGAALAVAAQVRADRHPGRQGALAAAAVVVVVGVVLLVQWFV